MEYTLIANTGIQLQTCQLNIDLNSKSRQLFHEWFDEDEVQYSLELAYQLPESQKVVRLADLESCRFISPEGKLTVKEEEVLANPNIETLYEGDIDETRDIFSLRLNDEKRCKMKALLNQWLPLPYFELDSLGNFKGGPYNWVRCKLIPKPSNDSTKLDVNVLLAVDTRAIYQEPDEYQECPSFVNDTEKEKHFRLNCNAGGLLDFCSGRNSWIRNYLMNIVHGVTELEDIQVKENEYRYSFLASYILLVESIARQGVLPDIRLVRDKGVKQVDVEMIVDIGNSRTAAILFEEGDFTKVKPLRIQNFTSPLTPDGQLNRTQESFDMRVAFQKVSFGENGAPDKPCGRACPC